MLFLKGIGALILTLALFSVFTLKLPRGGQAMSGLADAAIATFLVEAICKYILGDFVGIPFFAHVGEAAGSAGAVAACVLAGLRMGTDPVSAAAGGMALGTFGILPGFFAGYVMHFIITPLHKHLPDGLNVILCALISAVGSYGIAAMIAPGIDSVIGAVGSAILSAAEQSPLLMGMLLGGIIKIICTSPLSSMALTAMLSLTGLPMGIAAVACFGGSFTNGVVFCRLRLGDRDKVAAVMLEPLTQADIITRNPLPIYISNFFGGGLSGMGAAVLGVVCDAPGTAAPIPGMLAPFAFNPPLRVLSALGIAAAAGTICGLLGSQLFRILNHRGIYLYPAAAEQGSAAQNENGSTY